MVKTQIPTIGIPYQTTLPHETLPNAQKQAKEPAEHVWGGNHCDANETTFYRIHKPRGRAGNGAN